MSSLETFQFRMFKLQRFLFRMGEFQPFKFRCLSLSHLSYFCVIARQKFAAPLLYLVLLFCNLMMLFLFLFLSFSFLFTVWNSKFICIRFIDKKNREGHGN